MTDQPAAATRPTANAAPKMTPSAALARHVEWLEFALAAARSEETWRAGRLDKAKSGTATSGPPVSPRFATRSMS